MVTGILCSFFYLLNKLDLYKRVVESKKYTANTYLVAETLAVQQGNKIAGRFNKLSGYVMLQEDDVWRILSQEEEYIYLYYTAQACLEVTKSLFHTQSLDGYFYQSHQVKTKYRVQMDRESENFVLEVETRTHPYNMQDFNNPLKKELVNLEQLKRVLQRIDKAIEELKIEESKKKKRVTKETIIERLEPQFQFLREELFTKPLYEIESIARVKEGFKTLSAQALYLTLELKQKEDLCPYQIEQNIHYVTWPYELELGYMKAKRDPY